MGHQAHPSCASCSGGHVDVFHHVNSPQIEDHPLPLVGVQFSSSTRYAQDWSCSEGQSEALFSRTRQSTPPPLDRHALRPIEGDPRGGRQPNGSREDGSMMLHGRSGWQGSREGDDATAGWALLGHSDRGAAEAFEGRDMPWDVAGKIVPDVKGYVSKRIFMPPKGWCLMGALRPCISSWSW